MHFSSLTKQEKIKVEDIALCRLVGSVAFCISHVLTNLPEVSYKMYPIHFRI